MKIIEKLVLINFILISITHIKAQKIVKYDLYVTDTITHIGGKKKKALAVNGQIPMPTLHFTEGDTAVISVHNKLKNKETLMHWHGLLLPNQYDGVDHLTSPPIKAGETMVYKFPIIQNGTYWYHSHTGLQEQDGLYGAFIIDKKDKIDNLPEYTVLLSDWTNSRSKGVLRRLYFHDDWAAIQKNKVQKGVTQSYSEAIAQGYLGTKLKNEWKRMTAMDVSDVYYDQVHINGKEEDFFKEYKGNKVKLRIINGGSSSYFWVQYSGGKMQVIAADGKDVHPVEVDRFIIGNGETYDVIIEIPEVDTSYELLATTEDRIRTASLWIGNGNHKQSMKRLEPLKYFEGMKMMNDMMKMNGNLDNMGMKMSYQTMDMNQVMYPEIQNLKHHDPSMHMKEKEVSKENQDMHMHKEEDHSSHMNMPESSHNGQHEHQSHTHMKKDFEEQSPEDQGQYSSTTTMTEHEHTSHSMSIDKLEKNNSQNPVTLNYSMLKSTEPTNLKEGPVREMYLELNGNMERYVWSFNNRNLSETDKIVVKKGEKLRITFVNNSMMRHPLHLHGHFFRILNGQGEYSPLKHTMDIMPMEKNVIEFEADETGDWIFHCHILYHMMSGMGRVFSTQDSTQVSHSHGGEHDWKMFSKMMGNMERLAVMNEISNKGNTGKLRIENSRWALLQAEWKLAYKDNPGYEVEARIGRYIGKMQWFMPYIGYSFSYTTAGREKNIFGQKYNKETINNLAIGFRYLLPMRVLLDASVSPVNGEVKIKLEKEDIALTPRTRLDLSLDSHLGFTTRARYIVSKNFSIAAYYDSEWKWGAGLAFRY